jgi:ferrous iron transport protein B
MKRIAIAGNPNSGKTTIFNMLSGRNERIGNWAGVTVIKREARLRRRYNNLYEDVILVDLPGAYGMDAYTIDEKEATNFIMNEKIDVIINVVDASNLERSLFFTSQLIDTGIPVVIALNKSDITARRKTTIDTEKLVKLLNSEVIFTQATTHKGLREVVAAALNKIEEKNHYEQRQPKKRRHQRHRFASTNKRN